MSATFVYDGFGRREKKTINGNLTEFLYDGRNPVQETSGATILANILPGLRIDEFLTRTDVVAGITSNFLTDALGSPVAVTDATGTVQTEYTYEPFGKTTYSGASNSNSYQYTGRENDGTGLYYYRARFYQPQLQRFISGDSVNLTSVRLSQQDDAEFDSLFDALQREPQQLNDYSYVLNTPLVYLDPGGEYVQYAPWVVWAARAILAAMGANGIARFWECMHGGACFEDDQPHTENEPYLPTDPRNLPPPPGDGPPNPNDPPAGGIKPPNKIPPNRPYSPGRGGGGPRR